VKVWDANKGTETLTHKGHIGWVWSVAISADGKRIVKRQRGQAVSVQLTACHISSRVRVDIDCVHGQ